jgi:hypothetical protein
MEAAAPKLHAASPARDIEPIFDQPLAQSRSETDHLSDAVATLMHPAHLKIIGLGQTVLPLILSDLGQGGGPWFTALKAITRADPVQPRHELTAKLMRADWLQWGRENGYL